MKTAGRLAALDGVLFDVRLTCRGLVRDRGYSITAIATLVVALALNVIVFTVRDAMVVRGLPLANRSEGLVYVAMRKPSDLPCCPGPVLAADVDVFRARAATLDDVALWRSGEPITLRERDGAAVDMTLSRWTVNMLRLLGVRPALGRDFVAGDAAAGAPAVALISHEFWARRFGWRPDIVGHVIDVNRVPVTIVGVLPERFALLYEQELWMPLLPMPGLEGNAIGRLRDGATIAEARAEIDAIARGLHAGDPDSKRGVALVRTYTQAHVAPDAPTIYGSLWVGAWFVLLVACANLANLTLVRNVGRSREFATRFALGASWGRLVRQMLVENFALAAVAAPVAWRLSLWGVQQWEAATKSRYLALDYTLNASTAVYLITLAIAAAVAITLLPVARVLRLAVYGPLTGEGRGGTQGPRARRLTAALVAGQMALAIVLLLGAGVLVRSFHNIVGADTGVRDAERIATGRVRLPSEKYLTAAARLAFFERLRTHLGAMAGSEEVSFASTIPTRSGNPRRVEIDGQPAPPGNGLSFQLVTSAPDYFRVLGRSLIAGRDFTWRDDGAAPPVVLVNQAFVDSLWSGINPVGKRVRIFDGDRPGQWRTVVGVAPNVMQGDATRQRFQPVVYVPFAQQPSARAFVIVRSSAPPQETREAIQAAAHTLDRDVTLEEIGALSAALAFNRDNMDLEHADLGKYAAVAPIFGVIALVLAGVGLVAVVAHSVSQRTKEIGIRLAIGANSGDIARMVLREGMRPVAIGVVAGLAASLGANRLLHSQLVGVSPYDPLTMAAGPIILMAVAAIGCQIPARRAMRVDPAIALRDE